MPAPKKKEADAVKVTVPDAVSDGEGGYLPVGAPLEGVDEDTIASLKDKGLAE